MPASWNMPISEEPETIGVAVFKETYTYECLNYHNEATINVPGPELLDLTYTLGSVSGRDINKIEAFKVELINSDLIKVPGMARAIAIYESRVMSRLDVGECTVFVFEILKTKVKHGVSDQWGLLLDKTNLLLHNAGKVFHTVNQRKLFAKKL
jgi:flavin reductase (DIM6/NTAB) family NADH-FMN oxidoreductase RutF